MKVLASMIAFVVLIGLPVCAQQIDDTMRRHTLAGLKAVVVLVAADNKGDLAEFRLQPELRLRAAGISVESDANTWMNDLSTALLLFNISTLDGRPSVWTLRTSLVQMVCLRRDLSVCTAADTWEADGEFGVGPACLRAFRKIDLDHKHFPLSERTNLDLAPALIRPS